ncbi:MAG TPA: transaminase [Tianweitania sediminis]|nr:transaminase [Tianweitania sediminis]
MEKAALEAGARMLLPRATAAYEVKRPKSAAFALADNGFFDRVPMYWMLDWPTPFPMVVAEATGARLTDVDGNTVIDLCLGDTGAMFGHGPEPVLQALGRSALQGLTTMLPSLDVGVVGRLLAERFGLSRWQVAATASDSNRFAIRAARAVTDRRKILVFDGCYHGAVDETLVDLVDGRTQARGSLLGQAAELGESTVAVPFNDEAALEAALAQGDIACVLAEPAMTNCGMILPAPGFHKALRALSRQHGTLLVIDETHTISTGLGGYSAAYGLEPDILVVGKPIGGGIPVSVWGMSEEVALRFDDARRARNASGHSGIGTTLSGSALQLACLRACLEEVMTVEAYGAMHRSADIVEAGLRSAIEDCDLPWHVSRIGARLEVVFSATPPSNAEQSREASSEVIEHALHLLLLERGFLLTPFHNMVLVCPALQEVDAIRFTRAYREVLGELVHASRRT